MDQGSILWTIGRLERFKLAYNNAVKNNDEQFKFDGYDFLTGYAKYLIEYLEAKKT